uniref:Cyclin-dependent kinase inhibitor 1B n=1 Tax=Aotus nancymaae TaxID=37293 RepID=A0A2K5EU01_AOTNA
MSNVRMSNGSPSLERMDARQAEHPKPSACRNLFGPVDHEELTRDLEKHCRDMEEASQLKWNFDFQNHKPLEGKYEWQEVEKGSLPEFYYRPPRPPKGACKVPAQESQDVSGSRPAAPLIGAPANSEDTHLVDPKTDPSDSQTGLAEQCAGIRKRPAADDTSLLDEARKIDMKIFKIHIADFMEWTSCISTEKQQHNNTKILGTLK